MPVLLSGLSLKKSFGAQTLFSDISINLHDGDRLGLIGPNGAGKSTLLQILAGRVDSDSGEVALRKLARLEYVAQESAFPDGLTVRQVLEAKLPDEEYAPRRETLLTQAGFDDLDQLASTLSGGWRKRLAILEALVSEPDAILFDEPTNHLDLAGIKWLEQILAQARFAAIIITHDRYFLENTATHVAEMSAAYANGLFLVKGGYSEFLERKEDYASAQENLRESLANKVRREVEWLRRGPKARTTKSKARIDTANALIDQLADVTARQRTTSVGIDFAASGRQTKKLVEAENLSVSLGGRTLIRDLSFTLTPGLRLGLVGPNGSGKTTLLRLLRDELKPDQGTLTRAEFLKTVYFAQDRAQEINPSLTLKLALCPHGDSVLYQDRPIHVAAWAKRFGFRLDQLEQSVSKLSGGERARVQIARLMLLEADLLLLDEPTNDLDIPTLETLEENLLDFRGALVLVTHDRYMLDRVSTQVLGLDGDGNGTARVYADYSQWDQAQSPKPKKKVDGPAPVAEAAPVEAKPKKKLSYNEQREWDSMEAKILEAETAVAAQQALLNDPAVMADGKRIAQVYDDLHAAEATLTALYERWAELESKIA